MDIIRNFIKISGITDMDELPDINNGQTIQYSETETIFIPNNQPEVKSIFQIINKIDITSTRCIPTQAGLTVIIDGVKKIKILYSQDDEHGKANFLDMNLPYNTFIEIPKNAELGHLSISILDAYYSLLDERKIYSHLVFIVHASLNNLNKTFRTENKEVLQIDSQTQFNNILVDLENSNEDDLLSEEENFYRIDVDAEYL